MYEPCMIVIVYEIYLLPTPSNTTQPQGQEAELNPDHALAPEGLKLSLGQKARAPPTTPEQHHWRFASTLSGALPATEAKNPTRVPRMALCLPSPELAAPPQTPWACR